MERNDLYSTNLISSEENLKNWHLLMTPILNKQNELSIPDSSVTDFLSSNVHQIFLFSFSHILGQVCPGRIRKSLMQLIQPTNDRIFTFDVRYICAHNCFSKYFQRMNFRIFLAVIFFNKNRYCRCKRRRRKIIIKRNIYIRI
jgi:hypothetical protein